MITARSANKVLFMALGLVLSFSNAQAQEKAPPTRYELVVKFMTDLAAQNPTTTSTFELGVNDNGDKIIGLKIGNGPVKHLVVATHHGNEYGSTEVAKSFAASVSAKPLEGQTTYIVPVLNAWGYNRLSRYEWAKNRSNDPNRDYPGPCGGDGPWNLKSTKALADFVDKEGIVAALTLHTYQGVVAYPWGFSTPDRKTAYEDLFIKIATAAVVDSHYEVGNSADAIYPADGTFEDYVFVKHGIWSLLFELGNSHSPSVNQVETLVRENVNGMRNVLLAMPTARATDHAFNGKCDGRAKHMDKRDE